MVFSLKFPNQSKSHKKEKYFIFSDFVKTVYQRINCMLEISIYLLLTVIEYQGEDIYRP